MGNLVVGPIEPATNLGLSTDENLAAAFLLLMQHFYLSHMPYAISYSSRTIDEAPKVLVS